MEMYCSVRKCLGALKEIMADG